MKNLSTPFSAISPAARIINSISGNDILTAYPKGRTTMSLLVVCLFLMGGVEKTWGQLLQWNTFGNAGTETLEPSVFNATGISAANLTLGAGATPAANTNRFGGDDWFDTGNTNPTTLAESVADNDYIQFTVTPSSGYVYTPSAFAFSWNHSGTGPSDVTLRSSVDGYVSDIGSVLGMSETSFATHTISISGYTNLATAVTFRLYGYNGTSAAGTGGFDIDVDVVNVELLGTSTCKVRNVSTSTYYCTLQAAIDAATTGQIIELLASITEGQVTINEELTIDGNGFTLTSTSPNYGVEVDNPNVTITDLTIFDAGTIGLQVNCGSDDLILTNVTVNSSGNSGVGLNGSDNAVITNLTSTNNVGNGMSVTDCDNTSIIGYTSSGNAFGGGFNAGIGIFTSGVYCSPIGVNGFSLTGTVSIAESTKVYSQKANAAHVITGLSGPSIAWAVGIGALDRNYWPNKATAYTVVDALFEAPYNYPNTLIYVAEIATEDFYVDDDPNGDATPPMLIQTAVTYQASGLKIIAEAGTYTEALTINKAMTLNGPNMGVPGTGVRSAEAFLENGSVNVTVSDVVSIDGFYVHQTNNTSDVILLAGGSTATVKNCILDRDGITTGDIVRAITTSAGAGVKTIQNNLFTGDKTAGLFSGHKTWNSCMYVNGAASTVNILNNYFEYSRTALNLDDFNNGISVTGNTLDSCGTFISFGGVSPTNGQYVLGINDFKEPVSTFINNSNVNTAFRLDITSSTLNGAAFNTYPLSTLFLVEATMYHRGRSGRNGLVYYVANNQYVYPGLTTIQSAVDYAASGDIINVKTGTFNEEVTVDLPVTIDGETGLCGDVLIEGGGVRLFGVRVLPSVQNVTLRDFKVQNTVGTNAGIWAATGNNGLNLQNLCLLNTAGTGAILAQGPVNGITINGCEVSGSGVNGRGIVIWDGFKENITITGNNVHDISGCCGIELQDGSASGVTMTGNTVTNVGDSGMSAVGLDGSTGNNTISNNIITNTGRFGLEIKNPDGDGTDILVNNNTVSLTLPFSTLKPSEERDIAGIAVFRRALTGSNVDVPTGVDVTNNNVSGYIQDNASSTSEGFGIVIEGTYHIITGNTVSGNDVGIQQQSGHLPYPGNGDDSDLPDTYFGRGNSPLTCGNLVGPNTLTNPINTRIVGAVGGLVTNTNTSEIFCTIQAAVDDAQTLNGHTLSIGAGTYNERVTLTKQLTLTGAGVGMTILDGTGLPGNGNGITINTGITNVTIQDMTVRDYSGASGNANGGIYAIGGNNNLTVQDVDIADNVGGSGFYANGPIDNVLLDNVDAHGHTIGARGIVIWNGLKSNITITNCEVYNNNCCGIELQDGTASGVTMTGNDVHDNGDNGIGIVGLQGPGVNSISTNTLLNNGRFGIEIKNPNGSGATMGAGSIVVNGNSVTRTVAIVDARDISGIAVFRRGVLAGNVDVPNGVVVTGNTVSGYTQPSTSEGFGIVIEGTNHTATGNIISNNDVGLQQQAGHTPYPGDGDQSDLPDTYFGRGNSPMTCSNIIAPNTYTSNGTDTRNISVGAGIVTNTNTMETFCSIQSAIDDANTIGGHTISVPAGTFNEDVLINKDLTIQGAGIDITTVSGPIGGGSATFQVSASGVTIDGFTITRDGNNTTDWNNPLLNIPGIAIQGQAVDAEIRNNKIIGNRTGIDVNNSNDNNIHNNIITFNRTGLIFRNQTDNTLFNENEVTDNWTVGVLFLDASLGSNVPVQSALNCSFNDNDISGNWYGDIVDRQTGGALPPPGSNPKDFECNWYGTVTPWVSTANSTEPGYAAQIPVAYGGSAVPPGGQPNILGPASANFDYVSFLINGVDADGMEIGFQPSMGACAGTPVVISSAVASPETCAGSNGAILVTFSGGTAPYTIAWAGPDPGGPIVGASPYNITALSAGAYTITVTDLNGTTGTASATVLYEPVTNTTQMTTYATIQDAVNAANVGDAITLCSGTYIENVVVNEEVSITGAGQNVSIVKPAISDPNCGGAGGGSLCPGSSNVFLIEAHNVSISSLTVDGNNPALNSLILSNGVDVDARNGIITNHNAGIYNNLIVNDVEVKNIFLRGIYASSGGTFTFSDNTVTNVAGNTGSIAIFNFGGSGSFTDNTVSNSNDGIASNWSTGSTYSGNSVTTCGSGIHTDNNGGSGGVADIIQNNSVTNSTVAGYGIWVFAPYRNVQVLENSVTNVDVGLANAGQQLPVTVSFLRNTVNGMNKPGSTGVFQTTDLFGFGTSDVTGVYNNNYIINNTDAFYLQYQTGEANAITVNNNSITGNTNGVVLANTGGTLTESFTCNWWGSGSAASVAAAAAASTNYSPWLVNGTDDQPGTPGFQPVSGACSGTPVEFGAVTVDHIICGETDGSVTLPFSGGTTQYDISWTGPSAGSDLNVTSPHTIVSLAAGTYTITITDGNGSTDVAMATVEYLPVTNTTDMPDTYYATIQAAIDAADPNDVIEVCGGTYAEEINVNKSLDIRGPNYGVPGNAVRTLPEAMIVPPSELNLDVPREWDTTPLVTLSANNIKIDGFKISADNPLIAGYSYAGMDIEAGRGVRSIGNDVTFQNNIVEKFTYMGFHSAGGLPTPTYTNLILTNNKFDNIHDLTQLGYGFAMYVQATAGAVTNNTVTNSRAAIQVQPYQVVQGSNGVSVCSNNNFSIWRQGVYYNYAEVGASAWTINANTVTAVLPPANPTGPVLWEGIRAETMRISGNGGTISNNIINGAGAATDGIKWWGVWGLNYRGGSSDEPDVFFTGNTVSNVERGLVHTAAADIVVTGNNLSASIQAISIQRQFTSGGVMEGTGGINNIDATGGNTINGVASGSATLAQLYTIEDAVYHKVDSCIFGLVTIIPNQLFVTPNSSSIQCGIDAANSGWTVNVKSGTYQENVDASGGGEDISLAPGSSPGCVVIGGDLTLNGGDELAIEINGTTPCTDHDQFTVNGIVTLGGANLDVTLGYGPVNGDQIVIIENDMADVVVGQFAQGTSITVSGNYFLIDYAGGDGNDVVMTMCAGVMNTTTLEVFCTIQEGVDDPQTLDGHTLAILPGTYNERVTLTKQLTLDGAGAGMTILDGTGLPGPGSGIKINTGITDVTIKELTVQNYAGTAPNSYAGIYAIGGNDDLTVQDVDLADNVGGCGFYANGPITNVLLNNVDAHGHTAAFGAARGIVIWNGLKSNITITNCDVYENNCCGIELQDGTATGVTMTGNNVYDNGDNGIGIVGLQGPGVNSISSNMLEDNGRFGIEIKNPNGSGATMGAGSIVVNGNSVTRTVAIVDTRDISGIAVFRRGVLAGNVDVPNGVVVTGNTVSGYTQPSTSEGFGIVIEGTNHTATGNIISNNDVGLQQQAGHTPYPGDGDQNNLPDTYFGRGNSPMTCGNTVAPNTYSLNGTDTRNISVGGGIVTNTTTMETFCSIQSAIDDVNTINSHTLSIADGTYNENVTVSKELTLTGGGNGSNPATNTVLTPSVACSGTGITIAAANVTIQNMYVTNYLSAVDVNSVASPKINHMSLIDYCQYGMRITGSNSNVVINATTIERLSFLAGTVGIRMGTADAVNGLLIDTSIIRGNALQGIVVFQAGTPVAFNDITIQNSTISNNLQKGMYFEKLNNALFSNLTMDNNGTDAAYAFNNGIDINLKYDDYENITIENCDITNSGATGTAIDPENAAAVTIKARDDAMSYDANPATLNNVTIENNRITGPQNGIRFGEFGKINNTPTNVTVEGNDLSFGFANKAIIRRTNADIYLECNWHGSTSLPVILATFAEAGTGNTILSSILTTGGDASGAVGFQPSGTCGCASGNMVTNTTTTDEFCTIQAAIDDPDTDTGHVLAVSAGTYIENVIVDKSVIIRGPNYLIDPCTGVRVGEAIVVPATAAISSGEIFHVAADNVTISGLTIDGDNTALTSGFTSTNGADIDAAEGVTVYETGINGLTVTNNIIQNLSYFGVTLYDYPAAVPSSGHSIANNKIQNLGTYDAGSGIDFWGGGVLLYNNQYAAVIDNCMENVRIGVQTGNFSQANPGSSAYQEISGNTISSRRRGIFHNLYYGTASPLTISDNVITGVNHASETVWDGVLFSSQSIASTATNNMIDGIAIVGKPTEGYEVWNVKSTSPVVITGGSVSNVSTGLFVNNYDGYPTAGSNAPDGGHANVAGLSINPLASGIGIHVKDNTLSSHANVQLTIGAGVTLTGGTTGLRIENASASIVGGTLNDLSFTGQSGQYIELVNNPNDLDATVATFDGPTGAGATLPQLFAIEDKIHHEIEDNTLGFVTVKAANAYVTDITTPAATNNDYTRIRNAVELVSNNWDINLEGDFDWVEPNAAASWALGSDDVTATGDDYSIYVPANLNGITFTAPQGLTTASIDGPGDLAAVNLEGVLVFDGGDNQNWTISNLEFNDFDMPIGMFNGAGGTDAFNNTTITNNYFLIATDFNTVDAPADFNQNIGIHYSFGSNQTISNNTFEVPGDGVSNGANFSSTVVMQSNTSGGSVYDGLQITGNTTNILNAQSGSPQIVLGIWENGHAHTSDITVNNNQFNNLAGGNDPALNLQRAFRVTSHSGAGTTVTYSGNTVDGANIGFQWIAASNFTGNNPVQMSGNVLSDNSIGILVQSNGLATLTNTDFNAATDNARDLQIQPGSVVTTGGGNQWAGEEYYIENLSANTLDITGETFDQANQFRRTDRIYDALDNAATGLVRFNNNNLYVSAPATGLSDETIPNAISAAAASGDEINIESGSYTSGLDATSKEVIVVPGASPGCVTLAGNMVLTGGDELEIELNGVVACTGYDRFNVNGTVTLGGANLDATLGFVPTNGQTFTIIVNDLGDAVSGQFAQGTSINIGGYPFVINYAGGTGNDVVLEMCTGVTTITTPPVVAAGTPMLPATVPDVGGGGTYVWSITNGMITGGAGTSSISYTAGTTGILTIYVTVTDINGCVSTDEVDVTVIAVGPSSMQWVPDNGAHGLCGATTNCCTNIICYGLEYTPGVSGDLTTYTTGFKANCVGNFPTGITPIDYNESCVMPDNSFEINGCMTVDSVLFNSSGNAGLVPVLAGTPIIIHKVCYYLPPGEVIGVKEDAITNLSASIDLTGGGQYTEYPTYTTTNVSKPLWTVPAAGVATVSCPALAVMPTPPPVMDYCTNDVTISWVSTDDVPDPVICEGTRTYNFTYTDCSGYSLPWSFTYTIDYSGGLTPPVNMVATVSCPAEAVDPGTPPSILDACGRTVVAVLVGQDDPSPLCNGTVVWRYRYTACDGTTTADWIKTYTVTYTGGLIPPVNMVATVSCPAEAVDPGTPPSILDACGRTVVAVLVGQDDPSPLCNGTVVWRYRYTACDGTTTADWIKTYTVTYTGGLIPPVNMVATVSCPAEAVDPGTPPSILDACGRTVVAVLVGQDDPSPLCNGTVVWRYRYTACDGTTTADWIKTYTVTYSGGLVPPVNMVATVSCPAEALDPGTPPSILDACGRTVVAVLVGQDDPSPLCNGTVVWRYRYTACDGTTTADWIKTYTVTYTGGLIPPVNMVATVSCPAEAVDPGTPPSILDACGRTVVAVLVGQDDPSPLCNGTVVWRYRYTACDGTTTADWIKTYTVTYTGGLISPVNMVATVSCPAEAVDPGTPPSILDACGRTVVAVLVGQDDPSPLCNGTVVWRYRYTACDGTTTADWIKTYTVTYSGGLVPPVNMVATVSCPAEAVNPGTPPSILDACGRTVVAVLVGQDDPSPLCNGTVVWRYRYTACDGTTTADWIKTYTVTYSGGLTPPTSTMSTVACPANAVNPGPPANIVDACGRTVFPVLIGQDAPTPLCIGNVVWRYRYTACDGTTTVDWTHTYTIDRLPFADPVDGGSTVNCPLATETSPTPPAVMDNCGATLTPSTPVVSPIPGCGGTRTYTYTFTDCEGNTQDWVYTYTVDCDPVSLKVLLEGPYNPMTNTMYTQLNIDHLLPGQDKLLSPSPSIQLAAPFTPFGQPYSGAPWNYVGNMGLNYGDPTAPGAPMGVIPYPASVVDWVLVTVRKNGLDYTFDHWKCAGWVHNDGEVTFPEPCGGLVLNPSDDYYVVVEHRNHLAVLDEMDMPCSGYVIDWDFTTQNSYQPIFRYGQKEIEPNIWVMHNSNGEQISSRTAISSPDRTTWRLLQNALGYGVGDYNMDSATDSDDETEWKDNQNKTSGILFQ